MKQVAEAQSEQLAFCGSTEEQAGWYLYCVVRAEGEPGLESLGIQGQQVHIVVRNGLSAVVHVCPARPYQSNDPEMVAAWVLAHHQVVEAAWKRWGTVLPLRFNTIIKADGQRRARENLVSWLDTEADRLKAKLEHLDGKAECGIQVLRDTEHLSRQVAHSSPEFQRLEEEIGRQPRGAAYMYRQRLEAMVRRGVETRVAEEYQACYAGISRWADSIQVEKLGPGVGHIQTVVSLSCLVSAERYQGLAEELGRIGATEGFSIRLVGPMPPYSFC